MGWLLGLDPQLVIELYIRFEGELGKQATMFLLDLRGTALDFNAFTDVGQFFAQ